MALLLAVAPQIVDVQAEATGPERDPSADRATVARLVDVLGVHGGDRHTGVTVRLRGGGVGSEHGDDGDGEQEAVSHGSVPSASECV